MTGNTTSRLSFAYQAAVGTETIDDATDTTYFFGKREEGQSWKTPTQTNKTESYGSYSSRDPTLVPLEPVFNTWIIPYIPNTPQHLIRMHGQTTEEGSDIHSIETLDTGLPLPITVRLDLAGGSVDRLYQTVDNYTVGLYLRAMKDTPYTVEEEVIYGRLEDRRGQWKLTDTVSAESVGAKTITLTNTTLTLNQAAGWLCYTNSGTGEDEENVIVSNTAHATIPVLTLTDTPTTVATDTVVLFDKLRPILTTVPIMPGKTATHHYNGTPKVYWDVADQNVHLPECWKVEANLMQKHYIVLDSDKKYQTVTLGAMEPVKLTLECVLERHKPVYDYIERAARQINATVYKPNTAYYITHQFYNCYITNIEETGHAFEGFYNARLTLDSAYCQCEYTLESETNWSTHYKHVA